MAQVEKKNSEFFRKFVACAVGGLVAGFAAPVVFAYGGSMVIASLAAGTIASTVSTVTDNLQRDEVEIKYYPFQAQQAFRNAIDNFLHEHFEPVIRAIQMNRAGNFGPTRLELKMEDAFKLLGFANTDTTVVCVEFDFRVRPRPGTMQRTIAQAAAPPELPIFDDPQSLAQYRLPPSFAYTLHGAFDGIGWSALRGAAVGALGAVCTPLAPYFWFIETAPGVAGLVVGIPSFTAAGASAVELACEPNLLERVAWGVNFAAELKTHVNRVVACAADNNVDLNFVFKAGVRRRATVAAADLSSASGKEWAELWYEDRSVM